MKSIAKHTGLSGITVLIVEDEPSCRDAFFSILSREGASVDLAPDAETAIEKLISKNFDVILVDIKLPGMDGLSLLKKIKTTRHETSVIMITGYGSLKSASEAIKHEAQDYITKPLASPSLLTNAVFRGAERSRLISHNLKLENKLRQSEEMFRTLFQNTADAVMLFPVEQDGSLGPIAETNLAACRIFNNGESLSQKIYITDLTPKTHSSILIEAIQNTLEHGCATFESVFASQSGVLLPVDCAFHKIALHNRCWIICTIHDMTGMLDTEKKTAFAADEEAKKLGSEIHDVLCQNLVSINLIASALAKNGKNIRLGDLDLILDLSSQTLEKARNMARGIFPVDLEEATFENAVREMISRMSDIHGVTVKLKVSPTFTAPEKPISLHLYRIIQEAIRNASVSGKAKNIAVSLKQSESLKTLVIKDNGCGLSCPSKACSGIGMNIMRHRAKLIGAAFKVASLKNKGLKLEFTWQ